MLLVNVGFMFAYLRTIVKCWPWMGNCENSFDSYDKYSEIMWSSWLFIFGDWGDIEPQNKMQSAVFILWIFFSTLTLVNLQIAFLSESYSRLYEQRIKIGYVEMCRMILDLEILYSFVCCCRKNKNENKHLLFAEAI